MFFDIFRFRSKLLKRETPINASLTINKHQGSPTDSSVIATGQCNPKEDFFMVGHVTSRMCNHARWSYNKTTLHDCTMTFARETLLLKSEKLFYGSKLLILIL
ncbi:hypothetical protein A9Q99_25215 [Gammaproteobacteria bacterium 45_16_T64]|nr:hypothetical protein A9Q99_25215 [Gammaproteobacteria bacterium 45_16_T64]